MRLVLSAWILPDQFFLWNIVYKCCLEWVGPADCLHYNSDFPLRKLQKKCRNWCSVIRSEMDDCVETWAESWSSPFQCSWTKQLLDGRPPWPSGGRLHARTGYLETQVLGADGEGLQAQSCLLQLGPHELQLPGLLLTSLLQIMHLLLWRALLLRSGRLGGILLGGGAEGHPLYSCHWSLSGDWWWCGGWAITVINDLHESDLENAYHCAITDILFHHHAETVVGHEGLISDLSPQTNSISMSLSDQQVLGT